MVVGNLICSRRGAVLLIGLLLPAAYDRFAQAEPVRRLWHYESSVSSDSEGPLDLLAELHYDSANSGAPIAVVMHHYSATRVFAQVRPHAERLRDRGFFSISVAMRGREGSDGSRDSGGLEIYDIYDAVESVKTAFPERVDATNIHITGYSGGGGNALLALTRFPDYFRLGSSFFGMSDYGFDAKHGWYVNGAGERTTQLDADIGDPRGRNPRVLDRYHARAANLAAGNNPYSEIHLFVNVDEPICPPINATSYRANAAVAPARSGELDNIHVHIGRPDAYTDFNRNGYNEPAERQWWPHHSPTAEEQQAGEAWYLDRLLNGEVPKPNLNRRGELLVVGFVKTSVFALMLGDGANAAANLKYDLSNHAMSFDLKLASQDKSVTGVLSADLGAFRASSIEVVVNGKTVNTLSGGERLHRVPIRDGDRLTFRPISKEKRPLAEINK